MELEREFERGLWDWGWGMSDDRWFWFWFWFLVVLVVVDSLPYVYDESRRVGGSGKREGNRTPHSAQSPEKRIRA